MLMQTTEQVASGRLFTVQGAAEYLEVSPRTIQQWVASGRLRGRKLGKAWRFTLNELLAMLATPEN